MNCHRRFCSPAAAAAVLGESDARGGQGVRADGREVAEDDPRLAGPHVVAHHARQHGGGKTAAVRALQVGVLLERDRGVGAAERDALLRDPGEQRGRGLGARGPGGVAAGPGQGDPGDDREQGARDEGETAEGPHPRPGDASAGLSGQAQVPRLRLRCHP